MRNARVRGLRFLKLKDGSDGFLFSSGPSALLDMERGRRCDAESIVGTLETPRRGIRIATEAMIAERRRRVDIQGF